MVQGSCCQSATGSLLLPPNRRIHVAFLHFAHLAFDPPIAALNARTPVSECIAKRWNIRGQGPQMTMAVGVDFMLNHILSEDASTCRIHLRF